MCSGGGGGGFSFSGFQFSGDATYYGGAGKGGACSSTDVPPGFKTVALNSRQYSGSWCGTCVAACFDDNNGRQCFNAIIDNMCPVRPPPCHCS